MFWVILVSLIMILIGWRALALAIHLLSGQYEIDERLRIYAGR
jgi:hypothetical protein